MYCLNEDGQWDDKGTGLAAVQYMQVSSHTLNPYHADVCSESLSKQQAEETAFIVLVSEENSDILMKVRVRSDENIYARQQGAHRTKHCSQPHHPRSIPTASPARVAVAHGDAQNAAALAMMTDDGKPLLHAIA